MLRHICSVVVGGVMVLYFDVAVQVCKAQSVDFFRACRRQHGDSRVERASTRGRKGKTGAKVSEFRVMG